MAVLLSVNLGRLRPQAGGRRHRLTGIDKRPTADAVEVRAPGGKLTGLGSVIVPGAGHAFASRMIWASTGNRNASVFPEPVPDVTMPG